MSLDFDKLRSPFLRAHLQYVAETEPPRMFHIWSALTSISACMGRHLYLESGIGRIHGNMYVLLVGPPATKKSTAIKLSTVLMKRATDVKFAPDDTGGQRQGLIRALIEADGGDEDDEGETAADALDIDAIANMQMELAHDADKHTMFANASEFGSFIGQNSLDLTRFLIKMWDGDDFVYQLRQSKDTLYEPLLQILGGTTPTDIASLLPPEAIGQGFMSRCILVYAPNKEKSVPPSKIKLDVEQEDYLCKVYNHVHYKMRGEMQLTEDAAELLDILYETELKIQDNRFIYYTERRPSHLLKLTMNLCACDGRVLIEKGDVEDGHRILSATELRMPDALGEYGLSPLSVARQKMLEYLRYSKEAISENVMWAIMQKDMKLIDFKNSVSALINSGKISAVDTENGRALLFNDAVTRTLSTLDDDAFEALLESSNQENTDGQPTIN